MIFLNKVTESKQGYLGIGGQTVTEEVSNMYGLPVGVLVRQVYEGTGAAESGLQQGDVITEVGGSRIKSMEDLREEPCSIIRRMMWWKLQFQDSTEACIRISHWK